MGVLTQFGIQVPIFMRGSSVFVLAQLAGIIDSYEHTITATFGFESMTCTFLAPPEVAIDWLNQLMASTIVTGPDAEIIWEGFIESVEVQLGQERLSLSLDRMANRVKVRYTTVLGTPGVTAAASDLTSQSLYGVKDLVLSTGETVLATAQNLRDRALAQYKNPVATPASEVATGDMGEIRVSLTFAGWYAALDWLLTSSTSTTLTSTTTQVQTLLTAYNAVNAFFSTDYSLIAASGITDTELIAADTAYRAKIESLLQKGNSDSNRQAWGVYEGRRFEVNEWAGASPATFQLYRHLASAEVFDALNHTYIHPWNVRPDAMYQIVNTIDVLPASTADTSATRYIERVAFSASSDHIGVSLEPQAGNSIDAMIARIG